MKPAKADLSRFFPAIAGKMPSANLALASLALCMLLSSLGTSIANVGLPTLSKVFDASFGQVQWVVLAYLLTVTTLIVGVGRIGDVLGRRRLLLTGITVFTVASALCGIAPSLGLLIAGRALQGLGAAIMMALAMALVGEIITREKTGAAMGLMGTMSAIGTALGPSLGGVLLAGPGWRTMFFLSVPLGLVTFLLARRALPLAVATSQTSMARIDGIGTLVLALTLGAYTLAMTIGHGDFGALNIWLIIAALIGTSAFVWVEARTATPLIHLAMFQDLQLSASLGMNVMVSTVMMAMLVVGPFYLSLGLGLEPVLVGATMSLGPLISAASGVPSGRLVDSLGASRAVIVGLIAMVAGCIMLSTLPAMFGIGGYVVAVAILTPGFALFQAANNTSVMVDVDPDQRGVVSGLLSLSRNLGLITGASAMGAIFAIAVGTQDLVNAPTTAIGEGLQVTFGIASVLIILALTMAITMRGQPKCSKSSNDV